MNIKIKFIFTCSLLPTIIFAQNGLCGSSGLIQDEQLFQRNLECEENQFKIRKDVLQSNIGENYFECVDFDLVAEYANCHFYVESSKNNSVFITTIGLAALENYFTNITPDADNPDHQIGIKNAEEIIFGPPPDKDNTGIVNILILDVRDNFEGSGEFVAGYFDQNDQSENSTSNGMDIVYIDCYPVDITSSYPAEALYTLAHEYEHLLHYNSDPNEADGNPWLDEGLADLAPSILGLDHRNYGHFLANTSIGLDEWDYQNSLPFYSKSALFLQYVYENDGLGLPFIQQIFTDSEFYRLESVKHWFSEFSIELTFDQFFDQWIIDTVLDQYPISNCISGVSPQKDITLILEVDMEVINSPDLPPYASWHTFIPANVNKKMLIETNQREKGFVSNLSENVILGSIVENVWSFPDDNFNDEFLYSFLSHEANMQSIEFKIILDSIKTIYQINYDNNDIFAFVDIGNTNYWYGANAFFIESSVLLTGIEYKVANDSPATVTVMKGGISYTPQSTDNICSPIGTGWNSINITESGILVENENVFVVIELFDNAIGYSESTTNNGQSYYSFNGDSFSSLENVKFTSGESLVGNWAIRLTYLDSNFVAIQDTLDEFILHPNPFYPADNSVLTTYIITDVNIIYSVDIYNLLGKHIINLYKASPPIDKYIPLMWDGNDNHGNIVGSGMYFMRHTEGSTSSTEKFLLLH